MTKTTFASLKLKQNEEKKTFTIGDKTIEVLQYLPIEDKFDLVSMALDKAIGTSEVFNPVRLELYFNLYIVYMYTNIEFTDAQKRDEAKLYDLLKGNGIIDQVIENMNPVEYDDLISYIDEIEERMTTYKNTISYLINELLNNVPEKINQIQEMAKNVDPKVIQEMTDLAASLNGGRDIN